MHATILIVTTRLHNRKLKIQVKIEIKSLALF